MKHDITVHKGDAGKPAIIFIHGLGMNKNIWTDPDAARMLGGNFPLRYLMSKKPEAINYGPSEKIPEIHHKKFTSGEPFKILKTSFSDLKELNYTVIAWSQKRPAGPIDIAVSELREIIRLAKKQADNIVLVCHSRGGLIARKYLESGSKSIKSLITIASPHNGSSIAKWAEYISPLASAVRPMIRDEDKRRVSVTVKKIADFISSKAIKELLPGSEFFKSLKDSKHNIRYLSFGGTSPSLFSIYRWKLKRSKEKNDEWLLEPEDVFSFPDVLEKIIPRKFFPEELKKGHGDGLVSVKSSVLPWSDEHYDFDANHATILFEERVREKIIDVVEAIQ